MYRQLGAWYRQSIARQRGFSHQPNVFGTDQQHWQPRTTEVLKGLRHGRGRNSDLAPG